jgi:hypothetical protein
VSGIGLGAAQALKDPDKADEERAQRIGLRQPGLGQLPLGGRHRD